LMEIEVTREVPVTIESDGNTEPDQNENGDLGSRGDAAEPEQPTAQATTVPSPIPFNGTNSSDPSFAIFDEVWGVLGDEYDGDLPNRSEVIYSAIEGSLESLDDEYTRFVRPEVAALSREDASGSVSGIGAWVRENDEGLAEIVAPIEGQPADLAGLLPNDLIVAVDGEMVTNLSFDEVILLVRGPEGTEVTLTIVRPGVEQQLEFSIVRARFEVPVAESTMLGDEGSLIAYVRLIEFNRNAEETLLAELEGLLAQEPVGVILDLRNNPGGFLDQAIAVSDIFLPESVVLYDRSTTQDRDQTYYADDGDIAEQLPLVVLVNSRSASASEIVAGAVQDNGRGILLGETTFGKGSVQGLYRLTDGSELRVTIARWYTPKNISISEEGITPDIVLEMPVSVEFNSDEDIQLQRGVDYLLQGE
jgi:carboxyl-terminal processing protease